MMYVLYSYISYMDVFELYLSVEISIAFLYTFQLLHVKVPHAIPYERPIDRFHTSNMLFINFLGQIHAATLLRRLRVSTRYFVRQFVFIRRSVSSNHHLHSSKHFSRMHATL